MNLSLICYYQKLRINDYIPDFSVAQKIWYPAIFNKYCLDMCKYESLCPHFAEETVAVLQDQAASKQDHL